LGTTFRPSPDVVAQRVGDEIVLVHLKTDRIFALNPTGARLWELLSECCDESEVHRRLLAEFEVTEDQLARDIGDLLADLQKEQFIEQDA